MSAGLKAIVVRSAADRTGMTLAIRNVEDGDGMIVAPAFDPAHEAALVFDALMQLPRETRRALHRAIVDSEGFAGGKPAGSKPKVHPWPPRARGGR